MDLYCLTRPLQLRTKVQSMQLAGAKVPGKPTTAEVYLAAQAELKLVRRALAINYPQEPVGKLLRRLPPDTIKQVPGMPDVLGARALDDAVPEAPAPVLVAQLQRLRAVHPHRQHFRLLLINAFGTNLGDNLIGMTAFRQVLTVLRAELPVVSVDVLLGWHPDDRLTRLFRDIDGIDIIRTRGFTLAELLRYQAVFDTSGLLNLPRYGQMPMVDWYLWWMGLNPAGIAPADKRNAVAVPELDRQWVAQHLPNAQGPRILLNPKASVALRSMPEAAQRHLVDALLAAWPQAQLILVQPLALVHARVSHLDEFINTSSRLAALVAAMDGLIGVDTYTSHLADATATPAVTLYSSIHPDSYPYYPLVQGLCLPNAEQLPGWNKVKLEPQQWKTHAAAYEEAWAALDCNAVIAALRGVMAKKAATPKAMEPGLLAPLAPPAVCPTRSKDTGVLALELPLRQREDVLARVLNQTMLALAAQVLSPGDTMVHVAPGAGETALLLAHKVGPQGRLVAIEPRRHLHQLLCANLTRAGIWHAQTHWALPAGAGIHQSQMSSLLAMDDHQPGQLSNSTLPESVFSWPLDTLALDACRLLVLTSPLARLDVLQGARDTLARLRPVVLVGALKVQDVKAFQDFLVDLSYGVRVAPLAGANQLPQGAHLGILVAEPILPKGNE